MAVVDDYKSNISDLMYVYSSRPTAFFLPAIHQDI